MTTVTNSDTTYENSTSIGDATGDYLLNNGQQLREEGTSSEKFTTVSSLYSGLGDSSSVTNHQPSAPQQATANHDTIRNYIHHATEADLESPEILGGPESRKRSRNDATPERNVAQRVDIPEQPPTTTQQQHQGLFVGGGNETMTQTAQQTQLHPPQDPNIQAQVQAHAQHPLVPAMNPALLIGYDATGNPVHVPTSPLLYMIHFFASMMGNVPPNPLGGNPLQAQPPPSSPPSMTPPDSVLMPPPPPLPPRSAQAPPTTAAQAGTPTTVMQDPRQQQQQQQVQGMSLGQIQQYTAALFQAQQLQGQIGGTAAIPINVLQQAQMLQQLAAITGSSMPASAVPAPAATPTPASFLSALLPNAARPSSDQPSTPATIGGVGMQMAAAGQNLNFLQQQQQQQPHWGFIQGAVSNASGQFGNMVASGNVRLVNRPPVCLYMDCDDDHLSDYQILIRKQLELFEAQQEDVQSSTRGRKKQLVLGQIGIRCKHCCDKPSHQRGKGAVYYPAKLDGLYQASQNMAKSHLCESCEAIDTPLKAKLVSLRESKTVGATRSGGKQYWAESARARGVVETGFGLRYQ